MRKHADRRESTDIFLVNIVENRYGKSRVRVARIVRRDGGHDFHEMTVAIALEGDFDPSYRDGDNSLVLPTDTMKNTVYALAQDPAVEQPESFARLLASHFLSRLKHVSCVKIDIQGHLWHRDGPYSFTGGPAHRRIAKIEATRGKVSVESGVAGYLVMKTTGSAFEGFLRDEYTTLPEASDRILATSLDALWSGEANWDDVMRTITGTFASHESKSVQHTLYAIGGAVLERFPQIGRIRLTMPNKHYLPTKHADVFMPADEPHGLIEAVLSR
jgi:urate oxidase